MTIGLDQRLFVENGPAIAANGLAERTSAYRAWRRLSPDRKLAAVERRLAAANDLSDGFPLAL